LSSICPPSSREEIHPPLSLRLDVRNNRRPAAKLLGCTIKELGQMIVEAIQEAIVVLSLEGHVYLVVVKLKR
jgi:hypothetical protein